MPEGKPVAETPTWKTIAYFEEGYGPHEVVLEGTEIREPPGLRQFVIEGWTKKLEQRKGAIESSGKPHGELYIGEYGKGELALYEEKEGLQKALMWPGQLVRLINHRRGGGRLILDVQQYSYAEYSASFSEGYLGLYSEAGMEPPMRALGFCMAVELEKAGKYVATIRGIRTNVYPGGLHMIGGNVERADAPILGEITSELLEEVHLQDGRDYSSDEVVFTGLALDKRLNKPELVAAVQARASIEEIRRKHEERPDVAGYALIEAKREGLMSDLIKFHVADTSAGEASRAFGNRLIPPAHACLSFAGMRKYGKEWFSEVVRKVGGSFTA